MRIARLQIDDPDHGRQPHPKHCSDATARRGDLNGFLRLRETTCESNKGHFAPLKRIRHDRPSVKSAALGGESGGWIDDLGYPDFAALPNFSALAEMLPPRVPLYPTF